MNCVAIASIFRHRPEEDGNAIPAAVEREDPRHPGETIVDPIIGFLVALFRGRLSWSFMKYEAPEAPRGARQPQPRLARFSTARVAHISCPECGESCIYPVWGRDPGKVPCPSCFRRGGVRVDPVKEASPEYFQLMGDDLRAELEDAVRGVDPATAEEFRYPEVLDMSITVDPSPAVSPRLQGLAQAKGAALKPLREITPEFFFSEASIGDENDGLLIVPGATSGILDADAVREGWLVTEGCVSQQVRLPWLPKTLPHRSFGGARI